MHLIATTARGLDEMTAAVDLGQTPGDVVVMSYSDGELAALGAGWEAWTAEVGRAEVQTAETRSAEAEPGEVRRPALRLVQLADLAHPMSVDLWIDRTARHARLIVVRMLGGLDWWRYGLERLSALSREAGIALAVIPADGRDDPRLTAVSTLEPGRLEMLAGYFSAGGTANFRGLALRLCEHAGLAVAAGAIPRPEPVPWASGYRPERGACPLDDLAALLPAGRPVVVVLFYRALWIAADVAPVDALVAALEARGLAAAPLFVSSLKDGGACAFVREALERLSPAAIVTATAFAAGDEAAALFDAAGVPVVQAVIATTRRQAWEKSSRGLGASDLAMHVVLPEIDGRVLAGPLSFKGEAQATASPGFTAFRNMPEPDRVDRVAGRIAALVGLRRLPPERRRVAIVLPDYAGVSGRTGYAVGLDVPASVLALCDDLEAAGYAVGTRPTTARDLVAMLEGRMPAPGETPALALSDYAAWFASLDPASRAAVDTAWGSPGADPDAVDGAFRFRGFVAGNVAVALPPDRGRSADRRTDYHDPVLPPRHALLAFGLWLRRRANAVVHMGAHGTFEWLPGKAVALTAGCFPDVLLGDLPVFYPFIVSNPGEAAQAKRRIAAVTLGHLPPPLVGAELDGPARELERLVDEYAMADGLDPRRRDRLAALIVETARETRLAAEAGIEQANDAADALQRIDAWLCDVKELAIKDGLHVYGRMPLAGAEMDDPERLRSTANERQALLAALGGGRVAPGPAGAPARGRRDVLPTGRNLVTADPRGLPTETAMELGRRAADEIVRRHLQEEGDYPRALVLDLWGSATLRTGGEEIAIGLALLGCRPLWDRATGRVTGIEVLPPAVIGRPRVDVTWRISGLFRDLFPAQIALMDAAVQAVAEREEPDDDNPLAASRRAAAAGDAAALVRVFGSAPGTYGAGVEDAVAAGTWRDRGEIGRAYLAASSHGFGADDRMVCAPDAFAERVASADGLVHVGDDPGRDLLEGTADASFIGGFAAAAEAVGKAAALVVLDTTDPGRPRARPLGAALARVVRGRATSPRFIAGQMRHGPRGAAEFAETVDRLVAFAEMTDAVSTALIDLVHDAYVADPAVRDFILRENPAAGVAIAGRLDDARRRGLWHPRRNDVEHDLALLRPGADDATVVHESPAESRLPRRAVAP